MPALKADPIPSGASQAIFVRINSIRGLNPNNFTSTRSARILRSMAERYRKA